MDRHRLSLNLAPRHCYSPTTGVCTNAEKLCWCATLCTLSTSENSFCLNISLQRWLCCYWTSSVADNNIPDLASVLFYSVLQPSSIPRLATPWTYFLHLSLSSVILIDSSTGSPVHVLMLSIQAVCGLPRLRASGIVPCIIFLSPGNSLVFSWCDHRMLASLLWQCLTVPSLLQLC